MNPTSLDVKDILDGVLGLIFATNLFVGREPDNPSDCVTIFDTPGFGQETYLDRETSEDYYYPSIQIRVRNVDYATGWGLIHNIRDLLHHRAKGVINGSFYESFTCRQEPSLLDWDASNRARFVTSFDIQRR